MELKDLSKKENLEYGLIKVIQDLGTLLNDLKDLRGGSDLEKMIDEWAVEYGINLIMVEKLKDKIFKKEV